MRSKELGSIFFTQLLQDRTLADFLLIKGIFQSQPADDIKIIASDIAFIGSKESRQPGGIQPLYSQTDERIDIEFRFTTRSHRQKERRKVIAFRPVIDLTDSSSFQGAVFPPDHAKTSSAFRSSGILAAMTS